jgi:uroporphyrinogen III methyltransferase/synthase
MKERQRILDRQFGSALIPHPSSLIPPVKLVGAGPGDPGLLTVRAVECLSRAEVVLYDRLVPERLLEQVPAGARRVCVDEFHGCHPERWPQVYQTMIDAARQGRRVVRLKGGDPFLFGRGGEEAAALREAGIPFEVVPGVTAALGAAACAGIPLTDRRHASAVAFVTGHQKPEAADSLDWAALARFPGTLVVYMGIARLPYLVGELLGHGKAPDTPAAVIRWGTTPEQQTLTAPLASLPDAVQAAGVKAPALVIVGPVVGLRSELAWFESRPLFGKHVLVTRPRGQAGEMVRRLEERGASVSLLPAVEIGEPADWGPVDRALAELDRWQWLVFTSANGVAALLGRLLRAGRDLRALGSVRLAAIGPATAEALRAYHLEPDVVPSVYTSEGLAAALKERAAGQRVLLARADRGREVLRSELAAVAEVEQVAVYSQRDAEIEPGALAPLREGRIDFVTLTSSNIARALVRSLDDTGLAQVRAGRVRLVTISAVTTAAVRELELPVAAEAREATAEGVVQALVGLATAR